VTSDDISSAQNFAEQWAVIVKQRFSIPLFHFVSTGYVWLCCVFDQEVENCTVMNVFKNPEAAYKCHVIYPIVNTTKGHLQSRSKDSC